MKNNLIRKVIMGVCMLAGITAMGQTRVTHIVNRGENLQSIASRYGITPQQIIDANPDAAKMMYVGMELSIPIVPIDAGEVTVDVAPEPVVQEPPKPKRSLTQTTPGYTPVPGKGAASTQTRTEQGGMSRRTVSYSNGAAPRTTQNTPRRRSSHRVKEYDPLWMVVEAGCGLVQQGPLLPEVTFGVNYDFVAGFYGGVRVGYKGYIYNKTADGTKIDAMYHLVSIPVELGYRFGFGTPSGMSTKLPFSLMPYAGCDVNIPVGNTVKINGEKQGNADLGVCLNARAGARFTFYGFFVGAAANMAVGDDAKLLFGKGVYPTASIGYTF